MESGRSDLDSDEEECMLGYLSEEDGITFVSNQPILSVLGRKTALSNGRTSQN
jgi:hypothetical protein